MSRDAEADPNRNRSKSDNPKPTPNLPKNPTNAFKVTGQLILDNHYPNRTAEVAADSEPNSLQILKNTSAVSKLSKATDFVHFPQLKFDDSSHHSTQPLYSQ